MGASEEQLEKKIVRQIEYYFGDYNLSKDNFLKERIKENEGWVSIEVLLTFKRLKDLSSEDTVIVEAIEKSGSELVVLSEDKAKIRRNPEKPQPSDEDVKEQSEQRSIYVKGFPLDSKLDKLIEFFQQYGNVDNIQMRRFPNNKSFKGSVFVAFSDDASKEKFLSGLPLTYSEKELLVKDKKEYLAAKSLELEQKGKNKKAKRPREEEEAIQPDAAEELVKGCLIKITNLNNETKWEHIKGLFNEYAKVSFVDYSMGAEQAIVKLDGENTAKEALQKSLKDDKLLICDTEVTAIVLEGEEELTAWNKLSEGRSRQFKKWKQTRKRQGGRQGGGKFKRQRNN